MNLDFLGKGWNFPFSFEPADGSVKFSSGVENIRQNLVIILGTRPGERQMMPDFGCKIHDLLFAPSNQATISMASNYVKEAVQNWEPRVEILDVKTSFATTGSIKIGLRYKIRATSAVQHLEHLVH